MKNDPEERQLQEEFPEILGEFAKLHQAINRRTYPGQAWPVQRSIFRRMSWPVKTAAAAVLILAVGLAWWLCRSSQQWAPKEGSQVTVQMPSDEQSILLIPTNIDLSLASTLKLEIPAISLPSADDFGEFEFSLPTITFPSLTEDRRNNHEL